MTAARVAMPERFTQSVTCADAGSACAVATEDDAERVTDGVSEDTEARLTFTWDTGGTQEE